MDGKKLFVGSLTGGVVFFFLGFLFYAVLLEDFFLANQGSAQGVMNDNMEYWPLFLGNVSWAALFTYIFLKWAKVGSFIAGAKTAALLSLLAVFGFNMITYDTTNIMNINAAMMDVVIMVFNSSITGGVIALVVGEKG